ncbi:MAG: hypothetical protein DMD38_05375 [Gemmatimonadetes bacterium]|nr:MAG: hypothetical protein DMD38_05375 [Gemmatimonadota bacterium]
MRVLTMVQINRAQNANDHLLCSIAHTNLESRDSLLYRVLGMGPPVVLGARSICGRVGQPYVDSLRQRYQRLEVWMCDNRHDVRHLDSAA